MLLVAFYDDNDLLCLAIQTRKTAALKGTLEPPRVPQLQRLQEVPMREPYYDAMNFPEGLTYWWLAGNKGI